jgi:hypothetical protein
LHVRSWSIASGAAGLEIDDKLLQRDLRRPKGRLHGELAVARNSTNALPYGESGKGSVEDAWKIEGLRNEVLNTP